MTSFKDTFGKIKKIKNIEVIGAILVAALILGIYVLPGQKSNNDTKAEQTVISNNKDVNTAAEDKLKSILSGIEGAGKVEVMITYETGPELVTAQEVDKQTNVVTEKDSSGRSKQSESTVENQKPVTVKESGGDSALVLVEKQPTVRGVIVVAEGADSIKVKLSLLKAVQTALQVSPEKVDVFVMNKNKE
jgi:stage III sporulation protein AG